jgi:HpcH/HpaI aldolase/citrate lyase family
MMGAMQACGAGCHRSTAIQPLRSFLFAPGNHARRVEKALSLDADAVILDLEDAVATAEKRTTRDAVIAALTRPRRPLLYVRVNAVDTEFCYGDLSKRRAAPCPAALHAMEPYSVRRLTAEVFPCCPRSSS